MKKKLLIIAPIIILMIGVGVFLFFSRDRKITIRVGNWDTSKADFILCEISTEFDYRDSSYERRFIPKDEETFLSDVKKSDFYIGESVFPRVGRLYNPGYLLYFDGGLFSLTRYIGGDVWYLTASITQYDPKNDLGNIFTYYTPGEYAPDNSGQAEFNGLSFDEFFGNYEEAVNNFYGYLSDSYVSFDEENQVICVAVQDWYTREIVENKYVRIDFINKTVMHVVPEENEE